MSKTQFDEIETGCHVMKGDDEDVRLLENLQNGEEAAFVTMIERHNPAMVHVAMIYVGDRAAAEDIAQDTWLCLLQGIHRFQGRSTLKTWLFRILINRAKSHAARAGRIVPFAELKDPENGCDAPAVDPRRFTPDGEPWAGHWANPPVRWDDQPESHILRKEMFAIIERAAAVLPAGQQTVFHLRDVEGWSAEEVCHIMNLSEVNQRVLLHRARARIRNALERYWESQKRSEAN